MKKMKKLLAVLSIVTLMPSSTYAHSGRTDANGGHRDNKNVSGLGSYHYHCGGYPAHLHDNGVCPYKGSSTSSSSTTTASVVEVKDSINVSNAPRTLSVGQTMKIEYSVTSVKGNNTGSWSSSNSDIVEITSDGNISAKNIGTATITLTTYNNSSSYTIEVLPVEVELVELSLDKEKVKLGKTKKINANVLPENATDKNLVWKSDNENILSVDAEGNIKGISVGKTTITASTNNNITGTIEVEVYEVLPRKIKTEFSKIKLDIDDTANIKPIVYPKNANNKKLTIKSSNKKVATVTKKGKIKAVGAGKATITISAKNNVVEKVEVTVSKPSLFKRIFK